MAMTIITLDTFPDPFNAIIIGASGGIGGALYHALSGHPKAGNILGFARTPSAGHHPIDLDDDASLIAAAATARPHGPFHLIINATGRLHGDGLSPEKTWRHLEHDALTSAYQANCIGPVMAARHFLPLLAKDGKALYGFLSARVGSISDNRIGGWHGYRAAKAGLNMMIKNLAIEMAMKSREAIIIGLHPGTVATSLSKPFRGNVRHDIFTPEIAAQHLLTVINNAAPGDSGSQIGWDGRTIPT